MGPYPEITSQSSASFLHICKALPWDAHPLSNTLLQWPTRWGTLCAILCSQRGPCKAVGKHRVLLVTLCSSRYAVTHCRSSNHKSVFPWPQTCHQLSHFCQSDEWDMRGWCDFNLHSNWCWIVHECVIYSQALYKGLQPGTHIHITVSRTVRKICRSAFTFVRNIVDPHKCGLPTVPRVYL